MTRWHYVALSDFPHSRQDVLDFEVISPQNGHMRWEPKPTISGFSRMTRRDELNLFRE
jgi:hypothetical protein